MPGHLANVAQILYNLMLAQQVLKVLESSPMAQVCQICGKKPMSGNTISHAHNVSKRRWNVNLRPVHAKVGATTKRMRVCTSCLRSGKVVKA
jgi:large subunit ribosomal protein L28